MFNLLKNLIKGKEYIVETSNTPTEDTTVAIQKEHYLRKK